MHRTTANAVQKRVQATDWTRIHCELNANGFAILGNLLEPGACRELSALYDREELFRSRVIMARHGFGRGQYQYFSYPLPDDVALLREQLYPRLAPVANAWKEALGSSERFPSSLEGMLARCQRQGQERPTPLLLRYGPGDYNCLHQDLYGEQVFPLQVAILLDQPGKDFEGGEFVITEQRPRMQSRACVVPLTQGSGVVFAVNQRPRRGTRGHHRVRMRHGVSEVRHGKRHALGIIFHDAA